MRCHWCQEPLRWTAAKGWVHPDGQMYKSHLERRECARCRGHGCERCGQNGTRTVRVDDHCALAEER